MTHRFQIVDDPWVTIEQLEVFVALGEERHFGRAAGRLGISTSSLSKRLRDLEDELGVRLFARTSRRVALTDDAGPLLQQARQVLAEVSAFRAAVERTSNGETGTIRLLHANNHFDFVTKLVTSLHEQHPGIHLQFLEHPNQDVASAVLAGEAPIGTCWGALPEGLESYRFDVLMLDTIFVPPGHRLAHRSAIHLADLDGETFVLPGPDPAPLWHEQGIDITVLALPISGREEVATRVEMNEGLALTSSRAVPRYRHRSIVAVPLAEPESWQRLDQNMVWRAHSATPIVQTVIQTAKRLEPAQVSSWPPTLHRSRPDVNP